MKIDNDLALLLILSAAFVMEGTDDEEAMNKLKDNFIKLGIDLDTFEQSEIKTESAFVDWLEKTADKFQVAIEEYNALERED
jgi:cob(I)alamin adenosyltransferase